MTRMNAVGRNITLLCTAALVCNVFWLWSLMRAEYVDSFCREDSRVGFILPLCWVAFPMGLVFSLRAVRIAQGFAWHIGLLAAVAVAAAMVTLLLPVAYSIHTGFVLALISGLLFPPAGLGIVMALYSIPRDLPSSRAHGPEQTVASAVVDVQATGDVCEEIDNHVHKTRE
jgi:hypothetical protein